MTDPDYPYFNYNISSLYFLERAKKQLGLFDGGNIESLFYAALELRMGIEARLSEYLKKSPSHEKSASQKNYHAKKLFRQLLENDPQAEQPVTLIFGKKGSINMSAFKYTPVKRDLIDHYQALGELLHYKFFQNNTQTWFIKEKLQKYGDKSFLDYRELLEKIALELEKATSGDLLSKPRFTKLRAK